MLFWGIVIIVVLYLLMIRPANVSVEKWADFRHVDYAHRGLFDNQYGIPENSMAAFSAAVQNGYGIELDVQLTKDKIPVVFHDAKTGRLLKDRNGQTVNRILTDITSTELAQYHLLATEEKVPKLADVLKLVDGKVPLIIEFKVAYATTDTAELCEAVDSLLQEYMGHYCMESFHPLCLNWYRRHRPEIIRGQLADRPGPKVRGKMWFASLIMQYLLTNFITRPNFIAYNHHYRYNLSRILCRRLYCNPAIAWTIRSQRDLEINRKHYDLFIFENFIP